MPIWQKNDFFVKIQFEIHVHFIAPDFNYRTVLNIQDGTPL